MKRLRVLSWTQPTDPPHPQPFYNKHNIVKNGLCFHLQVDRIANNCYTVWNVDQGMKAGLSADPTCSGEYVQILRT
jgi:hypothetical protein